MGAFRTVRWFELELITAADQGGVWVNGQFEPARAGRLYIRKPGMEVLGVHAYSSLNVVFDTVYDERLAHCYTQHHFTPSSKEELAHIQNRPAHFAFLEQLPSFLDLRQPLLFAQLFQQFLDWHIRQADQSFFHQRAIIDQLIAALMDETALLQAEDGSPSGTAVASMRNWMDEHYAEHITLEMLARRAGLSREYLCRLFRRCYGRPPMDYLLSVRLLQARRLLINTNDTIESIAARCGFDNQGHFYTCFKKHEGLTPARYRVQNRYSHSL